MSRPKKEGNLLQIKCDNCGIIFPRYKSEINNRKTNCCSMKCAMELKYGRNKNSK